MLTPKGAKAKGEPADDGGLAPLLSSRLLDWYDQHRRALPWRAAPNLQPDPYAVYLSEVMLQQTGVSTVIPYFAAFLAKWPTIAELAQAPAEAVMRAWAGLGYYQRARNLHACAKVIAREYGGRFPVTEVQLRRLPGIGAYAAAAIAAIAFNQPAVVIDGNVVRVICRLFAVETVAQKARPLIRRLTETLTPAGRPGDFAQAMMDLGATICTPKRPNCEECPIQSNCLAVCRGEAECYPRKLPKPDRPRRAGALFYVRRSDGFVLVRTRAPKGLLGGMAEIPGSAWVTTPGLMTRCPPLPPALANFDREGFSAVPGCIRHVFTHFSLRLTIFVTTVESCIQPPPDCRWVAEEKLDSEAWPTLMRKAIAHAQAGMSNCFLAASG